MQRFAANLSTLFTEHPFLDRFQAAAAAGFQDVEFQFPYDYNTADILSRLKANKLRAVMFNLCAGDWDAGERGFSCLPGREDDFHASVERALTRASAFGTPFVHALAGMRPTDEDPEKTDARYIRNIAYAANRMGTENIQILIEPINHEDMPGYFLGDFDDALKFIDDIAWRGGSAPKLLFDIYHCHKIHGDVPTYIERCAPHIAHYQIAGTPDRHEPNLGDLPLADILAAVEKHTPNLCIGCEYTPKEDTISGLNWFAQPPR